MAEVFVPLNRFQSVVYNLTGEQDEIYATPAGVSSIVLSCQITNNSLSTQPVTIFVTSNRELPVPDFTTIYNGTSFLSSSVVLDSYSGSFESASKLLLSNRQFLRKEVAAYTQYQNSLSETPYVFISSYFENYTLDAIDAIKYDIVNETTIRTNKAAKGYYNKNGVSLIDATEYSASLEALDYLNVLAKQVIKNQSITGSVNVDRLYQNVVTQSIIADVDFVTGSVSQSIFLVDSLIGVIKNTIENPTLVAQEPIQLVTNVTIPSADSLSPVVSGKLVLEENYGFIVSGSTKLSVVLSLLESANE
jgi:hypothetical protein